MTVAELMSRPVVAISPEAPLSQAIRLMLENAVSGLPVVDRTGRMVGIITEGDLLRRVELGTHTQDPSWIDLFADPTNPADHYIHSHGKHVGDVMKHDIISVDESASINDVVTLMLRHRIKRLPVVQGGKLVGIVSRADLVRAIGKAINVPAESASDVTIRETILQEFARAPWLRSRAVSVVVLGGAVMLDGCVSDERERTAMVVMAENVAGVKRVDNRLVRIDQVQGAPVLEPDEAAGSLPV